MVEEKRGELVSNWALAELVPARGLADWLADDEI